MKLSAASAPSPLPTSMSTVDRQAPAPAVDDALPPTPRDTVAPGTSPSDGFRFYDETDATEAMVAAVDGAREVVNAEFYGFTDAGKGAQLVTALEAAARRGVEVNVVTDWINQLAIPPGSWQRMRRKVEGAGGTVIHTSRLPFDRRAKEHPALKDLDHRKVVTVDGSSAFVGGMNLVPLTDSFKDTMVGLEGLAAARLSANQLDRWERVGGAVTDRHRRTVAEGLDGRGAVATDPSELGIVENAPDLGRFQLTEGYRELIRGAQERLWIASPAISDREMMQDVNDAAARGVDVRVLTSGKAPIAAPVGWVAKSHLKQLAANGGRAWEVPGTLHRKVLVADDEAILSSFNLTKRSATSDHEVGIRTRNPKFVQEAVDLLERDMATATTFDADGFSGVGSRVGGAFARRFSY